MLRPLLAFCLVGLSLGCNTSMKKYAGTKIPPPNYIIVLVDDLGYGDVGFTGCTDIPTPNIDRLANQGVICTNGYVTWGACGPSRAGMITGRHQERFGFCRNPLFAPNDINQGLPLSEETIASALKRAEYTTVALGKWHLGAHPDQRPLQRGFDHFYGFLTGGHRYFPHEWTLQDEYEVTSQYEAYKTKLLRDDQRVEETEYLTDALSREAAQYVRNLKDEPFFMYLAYNAPHGPLQATDKYLERFDHIKNKKRRTYAAMVSAVDDGVGLLLNTLKEEGIEENTMIVFLSDNGGPEKVNGSDNGLLTGGKGSLFEGGIRVPFAIRWPAKIAPGTTYTSAVSSLDLFATLLANSGKKLKPNKPLDGVDLIPFLQGDKQGDPHETLFWRIYDKEQMAIRSGDHKLLFQADATQVFDVANQPAESKSTEIQDAELTTKLHTMMDGWLGQVQEPAFLGLGQNKEYNAAHPDRFERKQ